METATPVKEQLPIKDPVEKQELMEYGKAINKITEYANDGGEDFPGIIKMYKGTGINTPDTRTEEIGFRTGDAVPQRKGWYVCNGQSGTPDLRNKFIRSENASGNTGGSDDAIVVTHDHGGVTGNQSASHNHHQAGVKANVSYLYRPWGGWHPGAGGSVEISGDTAEDNEEFADTSNQLASHAHTVAEDGASGTDANKPAYYSLIFIIKMS